MAPPYTDGGGIPDVYGGIIMKIRQQFPLSVKEAMDLDNRVVTLLGDIGVWSFHKAKEEYPDRVYNIGILEQATISVAAGLAKTGLIPVVHTIAPFLVERAYEQLMIDFGYQGLGGNFISVGASYDYAGLGSTHYCPADVNILSNIPGMQVVLPGTAQEFETLFKQGYANGKPTYFRISEEENTVPQDITFGKANVIKQGGMATIIAVGPMLEKVMGAVSDLDVTVLYYTSVVPCDHETLINNLAGGRIIVVEPYYPGAVANAWMGSPKQVDTYIYNIGVPKKFLVTYGTRQEMDRSLGLSVEGIREKILGFIG